MLGISLLQQKRIMASHTKFSSAACRLYDQRIVHLHKCLFDGSVTSCIGILPNTRSVLGADQANVCCWIVAGKPGTPRDPIEHRHGGCMYLFIQQGEEALQVIRSSTNVFSYPLPNHQTHFKPNWVFVSLIMQAFQTRTFTFHPAMQPKAESF